MKNIITDHVETPWPTHADGRPKKMGEMTQVERKEQFRDAVLQVKTTMEASAMRKAIQEFVDSTADAQTKH